MINKKYLSVFLFLSVALIFVFNINSSYSNCMEATKHSYISKDGADHIASQCKAFIKEKAMVK